MHPDVKEMSEQLGTKLSESLDKIEETQQTEETLYRNYRVEKRLRKIPFRPSTSGTLKYQRVPMCGHKFLPQEAPRHRNCQSCWFTFFNTHGELSQACDEVFSKFGESGLKQLRGPKFTKNFLRFMSTVAQWKETMEAQKEKHGNEESK